jgi:hypothetical protein
MVKHANDDNKAVQRFVGSGGRARRPATEEKIRGFERRHGVRLPRQYRKFLATVADGGRPELDAIDVIYKTNRGKEIPEETVIKVLYKLTGRGSFPNSVDRETKYHISNLPAGSLAIGHDIGGDVIYIYLTGPKREGVYIINVDGDVDPNNPDDLYAGETLVRANFDEFLKGLRAMRPWVPPPGFKLPRRRKSRSPRAR